MENLRKLVEIVSNVAVILVALALGYLLISRYNASPFPLIGSTEAQPKLGTKLQVKDLDFSKSDRNLLLVLSTSCHFCAESMPFYRRLAALNASSRKFRMIGAFVQEVETAAKYLKEQDVAFDEVIKAEASETMIKGTPTLILTDKNGVVLDLWYGKLKPDRENDVVDRVFRDVQRGMN